jgi:hypothetical protein
MENTCVQTIINGCVKNDTMCALILEDQRILKIFNFYNYENYK